MFDIFLFEIKILLFEFLEHLPYYVTYNYRKEFHSWLMKEFNKPCLKQTILKYPATTACEDEPYDMV